MTRQQLDEALASLRAISIECCSIWQQYKLAKAEQNSVDMATYKSAFEAADVQRGTLVRSIRAAVVGDLKDVNDALRIIVVQSKVLALGGQTSEVDDAVSFLTASELRSDGPIDAGS